MKDTTYAFVFIDRAYQLLYNLYHFFYKCLCRVQLPYDYLYCFEWPYYLIPIPQKKLYINADILNFPLFCLYAHIGNRIFRKIG